MPVVSFSQADCTEAPVVIGVVQRTLEHWWVGSPLQYGAFVRYSCSKEEGMEPDQGRIAEDGQLTMSDASWEQARNRASVIYSSANRSIAHVGDVTGQPKSWAFPAAKSRRPRRIRTRTHLRAHHCRPCCRQGPWPQRRTSVQNDPRQTPARGVLHG